MKPLGTTWELHGQCLGTTAVHWGQLRKHHLKQQQMPKTSNTPNRTPSKPAKTNQVHKPKSQMRQRCFVSRQCSGGVPKMTNMRWMPAKIILNFPGRERCLQNDCWKDTSTRFNITQSYLVGKLNRNILRDEIYFQVTCCHFSGDSRHAVGLIFDIRLILKWIQ